MVEVVSGVGISVVGRGADNRGDAVVSLLMLMLLLQILL